MQSTRTRTLVTLATLITLLGLAAGTAQAATYDWNVDNSGAWDSSGNWTSGDGTDYPNATDDIANLDNNITADRTITIPTGGVDVDTATIGDSDAGSVFIISGGKLNTQSGLTIDNGATVQIDADIGLPNQQALSGNGSSGLLILTGDVISNNKYQAVTIANNGLTTRFSGTVTNIKQRASVSGGSTLQVAKDGTLNDYSSGIGVGGTVSTYGGDRAVTDRFSFSQDSVFDGSNGNLSIGGAAFSGPNWFSAPSANINDGTLTITGDISWNLDANGQGVYIPFDNGTLEITGSGNTYSADGDVEFRGTGSLLLNNGDGSATGTGNTLILASGVTLGGDGSTASNVSLDGTINPGNSVGELDIGGVIFNDGSELVIELDGSGNDILNVAGDVDLSSGSDTLRFTGAPSSSTFTFVNYAGTLTGTFDTVIDETNSLNLDKLSYSGGVFAIIPEPTTALLLALPSLLALRRRQRK